MRLKIVLLFYCLLLGSVVIAQPSKKALRLYQKALRYYSVKKTDLAIHTMRLAIKQDTTWDAPYCQLGQWYFLKNRFSDAADLYSDASLFCRHGGIQFAKALTKSLLYNGQGGRAIMIINAYSSPSDTGEWEQMRKQALFIQNALINQLPVMPISLGLQQKLNSKTPILFPLVTADTTTFYFTQKVNNMDEDLYKALWDDSCKEWKSVEELGEPLNTIDDESAQFISADGHYLFFARSDNRSENGWANGGTDLFMAYRIRNDTDWTQPQPFGATINTPFYEGMPSLSPDNRELFFVSDRPGGYGGLDIWISRFEQGAWQLPVNAGPTVNTAGNETSPYIDADNTTLYFASDGLPGMGGFDLFMSRRVNDTTWGEAKNLGFPINTACNEMSECLSLDGKKLYFASDRSAAAGDYDLYITSLPDVYKPIPVRYLEGYVYDSLTTNRLNYAQIFILNARSGDTLYQFQSNRGDGSFMITLPAGATYIRHTARMAYTDVDDTITLEKQYLKEPVIKNIVMLPFDYKEPKPNIDTLIATIHFDLNRIELSEGEKKTIREAIAPWMEEPGIAIYVNAYTDNTGTPLINEELSYKRAELVTKELVTVGVTEALILSKGWGEAKMIATNETDEGRKLNRRVEIVIKR